MKGKKGVRVNRVEQIMRMQVIQKRKDGGGSVCLVPLLPVKETEPRLCVI